VIGEAYHVLSDSRERKKYDEKRKEYREKGLLDPCDSWGEAFAINASGNDSVPSDSDDENSKDEEVHKPDKFRNDIYKEATPLIHNLLEDPDDFVSRAQIQSLNRRITKQNKKEGFEIDEFHISLRFLRIIGLSARDAVAYLKLDPEDGEARGKLKELENRLEKWVQVNSYPPEWLGSLNGSLQEGGKKGIKAYTQMLAKEMLVEWIKDSKQGTERLVTELKDAVDAANLTHRSLKLPFRSH
jgi:curved DNA-binding protein CbpA